MDDTFYGSEGVDCLVTCIEKKIVVVGISTDAIIDAIDKTISYWFLYLILSSTSFFFLLSDMLLYILLSSTVILLLVYSTLSKIHLWSLNLTRYLTLVTGLQNTLNTVTELV